MPVGRYVNVPTANPAVSYQVDNTAGRVRRLSVRETSGTTGAIFDVFDGTSTANKLIDTISLSAGQSTRDYYHGMEYFYYVGLYLSVVSGTFKGTFVIEHSDDWDHEGMPVVLVNPDVLSLTVTPGS